MLGDHRRLLRGLVASLNQLQLVLIGRAFRGTRRSLGARRFHLSGVSGAFLPSNAGLDLAPDRVGERERLTAMRTGYVGYRCGHGSLLTGLRCVVTAKGRHPGCVGDPLVRSVQGIGDSCLSRRIYEPVFVGGHMVSFVFDLPETSRYDRCEQWVGSDSGAARFFGLAGGPSRRGRSFISDVSSRSSRWRSVDRSGLHSAGRAGREIGPRKVS